MKNKKTIFAVLTVLILSGFVTAGYFLLTESEPDIEYAQKPIEEVSVKEDAPENKETRSEVFETVKLEKDQVVIDNRIYKVKANHSVAVCVVAS